MKNFLLVFVFFVIHFNGLSQRVHKEIAKKQGIESLNFFKEFLSIPNDANNKKDIYKNSVS